ncbi:MAG: DOMON-like domain-containing protein, partial [Burkholderiales bacterium]
HPHSPSRVARAVGVKATRTADGKLSLHYELHGDVARMNVPPPGPARIGWKLWRQTCCEVFVRADGATSYHELNFSPSGEWACYAFERYREGSPVTDQAMNPQIAIESQPERLDLYALVDLGRLSSAYRNARLRLGLAVIIEEESGAFSYWALRHAPGKPDFHHDDAFALTLAELRR